MFNSVKNYATDNKVIAAAVVYTIVAVVSKYVVEYHA